MDPAERNVQQRRWRILVFASCILVFFTTISYGLLHGLGESFAGWEGYYTLLVSRDIDGVALDKALDSAGLGNAISYDNALASLSSFNGVHSIPVKSIDTLAQSGDVRYDSYLKDIHLWFEDTSGRYSVVYIPAHDSISTTMIKLRSAMSTFGGSPSWSLVEWRPESSMLMLGAAMVIALLVVLRFKLWRGTLLLSSLPWLAQAGGVGPAFFPVFVMLFLSWSLLLEVFLPALKRFAHDIANAPFFWDDPENPAEVKASFQALAPFLDLGAVRFRIILYAGSVVLYFGFIVIRSAWDQLPSLIFLSIGAWPGIIVLLARVYQVRHRESEHRLFAPVPILTRGMVFKTRLRPVLLPLLAIASAATIGLSMLPSASRDGIAHAVPQSVKAMNYDSLLTQTQRSSALPGPAECLIHYAYQLSLPYERDPSWASFILPAKDSVLGLMNYTLENGVIRAVQNRDIVFNDAWITSVSRMVPERSIDALLLRQGRLFGVEQGQSKAVYSAEAWSTFALLGLLGLMLVILISGRRKGIRQFYGTRRVSYRTRDIAA